MKLVIRVKLLPTPEQATALQATLHACNAAANHVSHTAFTTGTKRNRELRALTYTHLKTRWALGSQAAQHVIKKTADAYAALTGNLKAGNLGKPGSTRFRRAPEKPIAFRPQGAQPYDDRMLSWQMPQRTVSIRTVAGRKKRLAFTGEETQLLLLTHHRQVEHADLNASHVIAGRGWWMWVCGAESQVPALTLIA
ncbi:hypothetical protein ACWCQ0_40250 [Streptomyces massasporeus]|uniref:hypothetical protein n=1 Tax=Streptomyces massasporeus TaxID=67324 RepID=UPI003408E069